MRWGESKNLLKWTHEEGYFLFNSGKKKRMVSLGVILSYFSSAPLWNIEFLEKSSSVNYKSWAWNCKLHQDWHNEKSQRGSLQSLIFLLVTFCIFLWLSSKSSYIFHISNRKRISIIPGSSRHLLWKSIFSHWSHRFSTEFKNNC